MRSSSTLSKAIQRKRMEVKGFPKKPKSFEDLALVPPHLSTTTDNQKFLLLNDTVIPKDPNPNAKRLLVFMSEFGRDILAGCSTWYIDGTFKSAGGTLFTQILLVIGLSPTGKAVPCTFALLPDKEKATYLLAAGVAGQ
jgi:hypothetical protein